MHATCHAHQILLDMLTLIIFGEGYNLQGSTLCGILQPSASYSLLDLIFSSLPFSNTSIYVLPLACKMKFHTYTKQKVKLWFCMF